MSMRATLGIIDYLNTQPLDAAISDQLTPRCTAPWGSYND